MRGRVPRKADSTLRASQAVPHPSTDRALCRLTSEVRRDPVHSTRYGRQRHCGHASAFSSRLIARTSWEGNTRKPKPGSACWAEWFRPAVFPHLARHTLHREQESRACSDTFASPWLDSVREAARLDSGRHEATGPLRQPPLSPTASPGTGQAQASPRDAPIFRILHEVDVDGTHQSEALKCCGAWGVQRLHHASDWFTTEPPALEPGELFSS